MSGTYDNIGPVPREGYQPSPAVHTPSQAYPEDHFSPPWPSFRSPPSVTGSPSGSHSSPVPNGVWAARGPPPSEPPPPFPASPSVHWSPVHGMASRSSQYNAQAPGWLPPQGLEASSLERAGSRPHVLLPRGVDPGRVPPQGQHGGKAPSGGLRRAQTSTSKWVLASMSRQAEAVKKAVPETYGIASPTVQSTTSSPQQWMPECYQSQVPHGVAASHGVDPVADPFVGTPHYPQNLLFQHSPQPCMRGPPVIRNGVVAHRPPFSCASGAPSSVLARPYMVPSDLSPVRTHNPWLPHVPDAPPGPPVVAHGSNPDFPAASLGGTGPRHVEAPMGGQVASNGWQSLRAPVMHEAVQYGFKRPPPPGVMDPSVQVHSGSPSQMRPPGVVEPLPTPPTKLVPDASSETTAWRNMQHPLGMRFKSTSGGQFGTAGGSRKFKERCRRESGGSEWSLLIPFTANHKRHLVSFHRRASADLDHGCPMFNTGAVLPDLVDEGSTPREKAEMCQMRLWYRPDKLPERRDGHQIMTRKELEQVVRQQLSVMMKDPQLARLHPRWMMLLDKLKPSGRQFESPSGARTTPQSDTNNEKLRSASCTSDACNGNPIRAESTDGGTPVADPFSTTGSADRFSDLASQSSGSTGRFECNQQLAHPAKATSTIESTNKTVKNKDLMDAVSNFMKKATACCRENKQSGRRRRTTNSGGQLLNYGKNGKPCENVQKSIQTKSIDHGISTSAVLSLDAFPPLEVENADSPKRERTKERFQRMDEENDSRPDSRTSVQVDTSPSRRFGRQDRISVNAPRSLITLEPQASDEAPLGCVDLQLSETLTKLRELFASGSSHQGAKMEMLILQVLELGMDSLLQLNDLEQEIFNAVGEKQNNGEDANLSAQVRRSLSDLYRAVTGRSLFGDPGTAESPDVKSDPFSSWLVSCAVRHQKGQRLLLRLFCQVTARPVDVRKQTTSFIMALGSPPSGAGMAAACWLFRTLLSDMEAICMLAVSAQRVMTAPPTSVFVEAFQANDEPDILVVSAILASIRGEADASKDSFYVAAGIFCRLLVMACTLPLRALHYVIRDFVAACRESEASGVRLSMDQTADGEAKQMRGQDMKTRMHLTLRTPLGFLLHFILYHRLSVMPSKSDMNKAYSQESVKECASVEDADNDVMTLSSTYMPALIDELTALNGAYPKTLQAFTESGAEQPPAVTAPDRVPLNELTTFMFCIYERALGGKQTSPSLPAVLGLSPGIVPSEFALGNMSSMTLTAPNHVEYPVASADFPLENAPSEQSFTLSYVQAQVAPPMPFDMGQPADGIRVPSRSSGEQCNLLYDVHDLRNNYSYECGSSSMERPLHDQSFFPACDTLNVSVPQNSWQPPNFAMINHCNAQREGRSSCTLTAAPNNAPAELLTHSSSLKFASVSRRSQESVGTLGIDFWPSGEACPPNIQADSAFWERGGELPQLPVDYVRMPSR